MKALETASAAASSEQTQVATVNTHPGYQYTKVRDGRKQPIRGLWERNGRYYAQLKFEDPATGRKQVRRVAILDKDAKPVTTVAQARAELERLKVKRTDNDLPSLKRTPKFCDYVQTYLAAINAGEGAKKPATIYKETHLLAKWQTHLGETRLDKIRPAHINAFVTARQQAGASNRSANIDVIVLRNLLKRAVADGWIQHLPTQNLRPLKVTEKRRALVTHADIEQVCQAAAGQRQNAQGKAVPVTKNARQFADYVRLMAYSGARASEALALRWQDVDFARGQLTIGAEGDTKNRTARTVDFNPKLKALLLDLKKRSRDVSQWLFPSPQRGARDIPAKTFRESLLLARRAAGKPGFIFHDCRHFFVSMCVMSGIDYMTIAEWVGHRDGGILIGKVYGHLADQHKKDQAQRIVFEPTVILKEAVA